MFVVMAKEEINFFFCFFSVFGMATYCIVDGVWHGVGYDDVAY